MKIENIFFKVDDLTLSFEAKLLETLTDQCGYPEGLESFANVQRR